MASVSLRAATPFLAEGRAGPLRRLGGEWGREDGESLQTGAPRSHSREGGSAASRVGGHRALWNASPLDGILQRWSRDRRDRGGCGGRVRTAQRACVSPPHPLQGEGCSPRLSSEAVDRAPSPAREEDSTGPGFQQWWLQHVAPARAPPRWRHGAPRQAGTAGTVHRIPGTVTLGVAGGWTV